MDKHLQEIFDEIKSKMNEKREPITVNSKVLIIDGLNTFIRCFAAIPTLNDNGMHIGGICGFLRSIGYAIEITSPTRVIVVFDGKGGSTRRKKIYPEYKEKRNPMIRLNRQDVFTTPDEEKHALVHELVRVVKYLENLPITLFALDNIEADDVIAYIATHVLPNSKIIIMSTDKDFLQLVDDRINVWSPTKKKFYTENSVAEEFGIPPANMCLFRAIDSKGDKSDNIKGIKGVGSKTIAKKFHLLSERRTVSLEEVLEYSKSVLKNPKIKDITHQKILEGKDIIERNIKLMQLRDVDISANAKSKILDKVKAPVSPLARFPLMKMVIEDKLHAGLPNMEMWLKSHFTKIDRFALLSQSAEKVNE